MAALQTGFGQDLSLYDDFMKEFYMEKWVDLLNNLTTTYKYFRRKIVPFRGRRMIIGLRVGRSGAVEAVSLSGYGATSVGAPATVDPGYQQVDNAIIRPKIIMSSIGLPQDILDMAEGDDSAIFDAIDMEMMGIKTDTADYLDQLCYHGGRELTVATNVDTNANATKDDFTVKNIYRLFKNKRVEVWQAGYTTTKRTHPAAGYVNISSTVRSTRLANLSAAITDAAANDLLFTKGARSTTLSYEMLGLEEIVSDVNLSLNTYEGNKFYLNVDRTANDDWKAQVTTLSGALTFDAMQAMIDDIHTNSGGETSAIFTTRSIRRQYAKKCGFTGASNDQAILRFMGTTRYKQGLVSYEEDNHYSGGGSDYMLFDEKIPIMTDRYCTEDFSTTNGGTMYFADTRHAYYALVADWKWWAPEGSIMRADPGGLFGVVAHAYIFGEFVIDAPNTWGVIKAIARS